ncbi:MAG TPA: hypothetical protein VF692_03340 [Pyrinomonadaceae bacterium]|jgi:hypothetical protein
MKREIAKVYHWQNNMVMVFDSSGKQIDEYQGRYDEVRESILKDSTDKTEFFKGFWQISYQPVMKEEF